jgi:hypothetical protein
VTAKAGQPGHRFSNKLSSPERYFLGLAVSGYQKKYFVMTENLTRNVVQ